MAPKSKSSPKQKGGSQASDAVEALMTPASYTRMERLLSGGSASPSATLNAVLESLTPQGVTSLHNVVNKPTMVGGGALKDVLTGFFSKKLKGGQLSDDSVAKLGGILFGKAVQNGGAPAVKKALKGGGAPPPPPGARATVGSDWLRNIPALRSQMDYNAHILMRPPVKSYSNP